MGSIRPLVTITILAAVGAYLYVKINEGPVPTRAGASLSQSPEGVPPLNGTKGTSLAAQSGAPAWPSTAASTPPSTTSAPAATTANPATASSPVATTTSKENPPAVPAIPELPPLPVLKEPAPLASQPSTSSPKDSPASIPSARTPDQPVQSPNAAAMKDAPAQASPVAATTTDPAKASPSTSSATTPATSAVTQPATSGVGAASAVPAAQSSAQNPLRTTLAAMTPAADPSDRYATAPAATTSPAAATTSSTTPTTPIGAPAATSFAASWPAIQSALDRRELKQAHQLLSKWHGDETLSPTDTEKVETLLSQLAGTVIYSTEHQLEPARTVKPGETLDAVAKEYNVPAQLLAKINGIQPTAQLQPGQQLKVVRGPFAAVIDVRRNELTLTVDDRYAGKFHLTIPPGVTLTDGQWLVEQKLAGSPSSATPSAYATTPIPADRTIILRNSAATAAGSPTLVIASGSGIGLASNPPALRVSAQDAEELSDILSVGSRVVIRK